MVRCADCGFLCVRRHSDRQLCEVEADIRKTWHIPIEDKRRIYRDLPLCFVRKADLQAGGDADKPATVLRIIQAERECDGFTPWHQGYSPREHKDMLDAKAMQAWMVEQRNSDRWWNLCNAGVSALISALVAGIVSIVSIILAR